MNEINSMKLFHNIVHKIIRLNNLDYSSIFLNFKLIIY